MKIHYLSILILVWSSCSNIKKPIAMSNCGFGIWKITTVDSFYYELYIDKEQQFLFDSKAQLPLIVENSDTMPFHELKVSLCNSASVARPALVEGYFSKHVIMKSLSIENVEYFSDFCYRISTSEDENYDLFASESIKRWQIHFGYTTPHSETKLIDIDTLVEIHD